MKGFRRCWVRSASLARAIIGCREPMQADTVRRARLIRARVAEVVGPVWARGASAVRFWLGLGRADAGCCGSVFVPSPRVTHASWRLAALRFVTWPLLFATWICRLSHFACVLCCALRTVCGHTARLFPAVLSRSPSSLHPLLNRVPISTFLAENCGCERFKRSSKGSWQETIVLTYF